MRQNERVAFDKLRLSGLFSRTKSPSPLGLSLSKPARCLCLTLLLAACSKGGAPAAPEGESIACALGGSLQFKPQCTVERQDGNVVVRLPDGAFHRFTVSKDGEHLDPADGADVAQSARKGDRFEVILGQDRYVIPVKPGAANN